MIQYVPASVALAQKLAVPRYLRLEKGHQCADRPHLQHEKQCFHIHGRLEASHLVDDLQLRIFPRYPKNALC